MPALKAMAKPGILDLPDWPNQPTSYSFPRKSIGKKIVVEHSCQAAWFQTWRWLHYDKMNEKTYCFYRTKEFKEKKLKASNAEPAFISDF